MKEQDPLSADALEKELLSLIDGGNNDTDSASKKESHEGGGDQEKEEAEEDPTLKMKRERDERSIFVQNVDHAATEEDIKTQFEDCGTINSVTIPTNKHNGRSKGIAYVEFMDKDAVKLALEKKNVIINGRPLKINEKRTNIPSFQRGIKPKFHGHKKRFKPRGRGYRPRRHH